MIENLIAIELNYDQHIIDGPQELDAIWSFRCGCDLIINPDTGEATMKPFYCSKHEPTAMAHSA